MLNGLSLDINDFGAINRANIKINKITVVGGVNASGKSTASRLLYCFLKAMSSNRNEIILKSILPKINWFINTVESPQIADHNLPDKFIIDDDIEEILNGYRIARNKFVHKPVNYVIPEEFIFEEMREIENCIPVLKQDIGKNYSAVVKTLFRSESLLIYKGNSTFYSNSFKSYVSYKNTKKPYDTIMERERDIKSEKLISFDDLDKNYIYASKGEFESLNDVFFIDSISLFDLYFYLNDFFDYDDLEYKEHVIQLLANLSVEWEVNKEIEKKIDSVNEIFNKLFKNFNLGREKIIENLKSYYGSYSYINHIHQVNANNSSGVQQIEIVGDLLNSKKLIPGTFLIIDEPEVNLHPEWQFKLAEILVLLAKELDIAIYLNSHSPMFIESIDAFAEYYDMSDDVNYYLTEESEFEGRYNFTEIHSNELYKIYQNLGNTYKLINQLKIRKRLNKQV